MFASSPSARPSGPRASCSFAPFFVSNLIRKKRKRKKKHGCRANFLRHRASLGGAKHTPSPSSRRNLSNAGPRKNDTVSTATTTATISQQLQRQNRQNHNSKPGALESN